MNYTYAKNMAHQVKKQLGATLRSSGATFRVWAPFAESVSISGTFTPDGSVELFSEGDGYWSVSIKGVEAGQLYKYMIKTSDGRSLERNDPRARAITASDRGFSVVADNDFDWGDTNFVSIPKQRQVIYEMHVGTFNRPDPVTTGTFETAIEKLDYLRDLGVTTIELMPVTSMAYSNGWGYAPNHIFSVESMLGGRFGLMSFVKACHERGMAVLLDVVYNHFSNETDLWQFDGWSENNRGGIYFYNDERGDTPWGGRPDYGRPEVRQFILDNITMWFTEYKLDGLRLDSTIYMRNTAGLNDDPWHDLPDAWLLLQDITKLAHKLNPQALLIAEDFSVNEYITKPRTIGGCGFDAQWGLGFPHSLRKVFGSGEGDLLSDLVRDIEHSFNNDCFQKIIFSDSHDSAANGSTRLNDTISPRDPSSFDARQKALLGSAIALTSPGIPMILQGSEFLQEGSFNDWLALDWDLFQKFNGFWLAIKHLINLRTNQYGNTDGLLGANTLVFHYDAKNLVLAYVRYSDDISKGSVVILNLGNTSFTEYKINFPFTGRLINRFNSTWIGYDRDNKQTDSRNLQLAIDKPTEITLPSLACFVFSRD